VPDRWEHIQPVVVLQTSEWQPRFGRPCATNKTLTDDDCLPPPAFLESLVTAHRQSPDSLVGGITFNGLTDDVFATTSQVIIDLVYRALQR
jgi:hypothetical protein